MSSVNVSAAAKQSIGFAAGLLKVSESEIVDRLVAYMSSLTGSSPPTPATAGGGVAVYADYDGIRTHGLYDPATQRIDITDGPLAGKRFKTPSAAARDVVAHYRPNVNSNRNGWGFWFLADGSGALQTIRHS